MDHANFERSAELQRALESDEMPTDPLSMVWQGMKVLLRDNSIMKKDLADLQLRTKNLEEVNESHDKSVESLQVSVKLLEAKLTRNETIQQSMQDEIDDLKSRSMKDNIYFSFDPECDEFKVVKGENCAELVRAFLRNILGLTVPIYIQSAHRVADGRMIARIPESAQRSLIFKNANRLRDTRHYLSQQMPPGRSERRQFALPYYKDMKADGRNKAVLAQDKLYVRNKLQLQYVKPSLPVCPLTDESPCRITESRSKKDGGSVFHGYAAHISDITDVADIRQYLITNNPEVTNASHVIYAFRYESRGKTHENFDSDRDHGCGFELLKMMRQHDITNALCIATRKCNPGFSHIGKRRFTHINEACLNAYTSLSDVQSVQ